MRLWLLEIYAKNPETGEGGWDIHFAWVGAETAEGAILLAQMHVPHYDELITINEQAKVVPLALERGHVPFMVNVPAERLV